jgi:hypothetical protein
MKKKMMITTEVTASRLMIFTCPLSKHRLYLFILLLFYRVIL